LFLVAESLLFFLAKVGFENRKKHFVLVYGNKTPEDTIFHQQLHDLHQYVGRFLYIMVYSQASEEALFWSYRKATVNFVLNNKHKEWNLISFTFADQEIYRFGCFERENVKESAISLNFYEFDSSKTRLKD
jgi:ring-1,2-phenylacetyl-CoA epoxidase subunit PaaE